MENKIKLVVFLVHHILCRNEHKIMPNDNHLHQSFFSPVSVWLFETFLKVNNRSKAYSWSGRAWTNLGYQIESSSI